VDQAKWFLTHFPHLVKEVPGEGLEIPREENMNDLTLLGIGRAEDHLAVHVVEIVGDRLGIVHVPVVDGRVSVNIP